MPLACRERYGMLIIIGMLFVLPMMGAQLGMDLKVCLWLISGSANIVIGAILNLTGNT
jgi:hypothetical protein